MKTRKEIAFSDESLSKSAVGFFWLATLFWLLSVAHFALSGRPEIERWIVSIAAVMLWALAFSMYCIVTLAQSLRRRIESIEDDIQKLKQEMEHTTG